MILVSAALKYKDIIICSPRHFDTISSKIVSLLNLPSSEHIEQGFVDAKGNFYGRKEAYKIAKENGQLKKENSLKILFSEDLY